MPEGYVPMAPAVTPLIPYNGLDDPLTADASPLAGISADDAMALGYYRARNDLSRAASTVGISAIAGAGRLMQDVQSARDTGWFSVPNAPEYHGQQMTFTQSVLGSVGAGIMPRNIRAADYQQIARRDLSERLAMGATGMVTEVALPSILGLAAAGAAGGGLPGAAIGLGVGLGADALFNNDIIRRHLQRSTFLEESSGRYIRPGVRRPGSEGGFTRREAMEVFSCCLTSPSLPCMLPEQSTT